MEGLQEKRRERSQGLDKISGELKKATVEPSLTATPLSGVASTKGADRAGVDRFKRRAWKSPAAPVGTSNKGSL